MCAGQVKMFGFSSHLFTTQHFLAEGGGKNWAISCDQFSKDHTQQEYRLWLITYANETPCGP